MSYMCGLGYGDRGRSPESPNYPGNTEIGKVPHELASRDNDVYARSANATESKS